MNGFKKKASEILSLLKEWVEQDRRHKWFLIIAGVCLGLFLISGGEETSKYVFYGEDYKKVSKGRTIKNPYRDLATDKMALIEKAEKSIRKENKAILSEVEGVKSSLSELSSKLDELKKKGAVVETSKAEKSKPESVDSMKKQESDVASKKEPINSYPGSVSGPSTILDNSVKKPVKKKVRRGSSPLGPYSVTFPVNVKGEDVKTGIVIGKGSRVLGKVLGGAEVPMGETYPVLIQLDYAFVMANNKKVDLRGCVLIAKSETVFATGKMKMEPDSITCYGPNGSLYSKNKIKGWFNDPKDDNFGMSAELKTNAGKKSLGVFGSAFVEGLGAAIERGSRSVGGRGIDVRPNIVLQDSGQKAGAKAGQLFMEYLNGLKPTLKVTSGRDTWLVLGSELVIPYNFFNERREYAKSRSDSISSFVQ